MIAAAVRAHGVMRMQEHGPTAQGYVTNKFPADRSEAGFEMDRKFVELGMLEPLRQPSNCPYLNADDLGFWNALDSQVQARAGEFVKRMSMSELEAKMIQIVREEFDRFDSELIDDIFRHKLAITERIIADGDRGLVRMPHLGTRQKKVEKFKEKGWKRIPHKGVVSVGIKDGDEKKFFVTDPFGKFLAKTTASSTPTTSESPR